jgi:hypothetical protein
MFFHRMLCPTNSVHKASISERRDRGFRTKLLTGPVSFGLRLEAASLISHQERDSNRGKDLLIRAGAKAAPEAIERPLTRP